MEEPFTMNRLEDLLSASQIKTQFFNFGFGLFNVYLRAYKKYGDFNDPTDSTGKRYSDFTEVQEDIEYINERNGGKSLLRYWLETNKRYVGKNLFGKYHKRVNYLEKALIENRGISDFVYTELITEFLSLISLSGEQLISKYDFASFKDERRLVFPAYIEALESVYRLYIQDALK